MTPFEEETVALLADLRAERRKAEMRVVNARHALEDASARERAALLTLRLYRQKFGIAAPVVAEKFAPYAGLGPKQVIDRWANEHDGHVSMNDLCDFAVEAGWWSTKLKAEGTLHKTINRMAFQRIGRGVYRRTALGEAS